MLRLIPPKFRSISGVFSWQVSPDFLLPKVSRQTLIDLTWGIRKCFLSRLCFVLPGKARYNAFQFLSAMRAHKKENMLKASLAHFCAPKVKEQAVKEVPLNQVWKSTVENRSKDTCPQSPDEQLGAPFDPARTDTGLANCGIFENTCPVRYLESKVHGWKSWKNISLHAHVTTSRYSQKWYF